MFADAKKKSKHGGECQKKNELLKCQQSADPDSFFFSLTRYRGTDGWSKYANSETLTPSTAMQHGWIGVGRLRATYVAN